MKVIAQIDKEITGQYFGRVRFHSSLFVRLPFAHVRSHPPPPLELFPRSFVPHRPRPQPWSLSPSSIRMRPAYAKFEDLLKRYYSTLPPEFVPSNMINYEIEKLLQRASAVM